MKICMMLPAFFPPDIRVEKEARSLQSAGHVVHLICAGREGQSAEQEIEGIGVHRLFEARVSRRGVARLVPLPYIWNRPLMRAWRERLTDVVRAHGIQALHVHDLPLVEVALQVGRRGSLPVVFDMHENWPEALRVWTPSRSRLLSRVLMLIYKRREDHCLRRVQRVVVVVDEQKARLVALGVPRDRITVVMNTVDIAHFVEQPGSGPLRDRYRGRFVVSYIGAFGPHRGLETAVEAMAIVRETRPDALLLLVGTGTNFDQLKRLVAERKLEAGAELTGWVDSRDVPQYTGLSDVGLIPHLASAHTDTTIPHKLFQYMLLKRPVVVTDARPLQRIVGETGCGLVVPSGDASAMAAAIIRLHGNPELRQRCGEAGERAVRATYNWDREAEKLLALYAGLGT